MGTPHRRAGTTLCPPGCGPCRHPRRLQPPRTSPPRRAFGLRPKPPKFCPCDALSSVRHGFFPLPCALPDGSSPPSEVHVLLFPEPFGLGLMCRCLISHLRFVGTARCAGAGGLGWQLQGVGPGLNRTLRFHGRFGVDPLPRCTCRVSGKALTGPGATPFHRMVCAFRYPSPQRARSETWAARWGGACKGPQDATAGILALMNRVWYPARRAIARSVVVLKEIRPEAA